MVRALKRAKPLTTTSHGRPNTYNEVRSASMKLFAEAASWLRPIELCVVFVVGSRGDQENWIFTSLSWKGDAEKAQRVLINAFGFDSLRSRICRTVVSVGCDAVDSKVCYGAFGFLSVF